MADTLNPRQLWLFAIAAMGAWLFLGWPVIEMFLVGSPFRGAAIPAWWFAPFAIFGAAATAAITMRLSGRAFWALQAVQVLAVIGMAVAVNWAMMAMFLIIVAWQVAMMTTPAKALGWSLLQTFAVVGTLAVVPKPDICWVLWMSFGLQQCMLVTATALRREAVTARALKHAQALIASNARDAERLRISRELHDAWGHELTALGLQLEIASHVDDRAKANDHVIQAKGLARTLLSKVRDVVSTLRDDQRRDLHAALLSLADSVPAPAIHIEVEDDLAVSPEQAHALIRCAQEAVTNSVRHAQAENLWLRVAFDGDGVRLVAHDDGKARAVTSAPGSGLRGMRERLEQLGGRLAVRKGAQAGFTIDAWLPAATPQAA